MAEIINFAPRASGGSCIKPNSHVSQELQTAMKKLSSMVANRKLLSENPENYSNMAAMATNVLQSIAEEYGVEPRSLITDILYIQASKDIIDNLTGEE